MHKQQKALRRKLRRRQVVEQIGSPPPRALVAHESKLFNRRHHSVSRVTAAKAQTLPVNFPSPPFAFAARRLRRR